MISKKRPGRYVNFKKDGKIEKVFVFDDDLTRYVLKFSTDTNEVVISYHDPELPISDMRPIRKVVQKAYEGSAVYMAFAKVLDNYELKTLEDVEEYDPTRHFVITDPKVRKDLTDVSNNLKGRMPDDFRNFFFHVFGGGKVLRINTVITQADIDKLGLGVVAMNEYLGDLKDFALIDEQAGWR